MENSPCPTPRVRSRQRAPALAANSIDNRDLAHHVEMRPTDALRPYARNARTHSDRQLTRIAASIQEFGFIDPILINPADEVVAGHGRLLAAQRLGMREVPTLRIEHLSPAQIQAYRIAANRLAELAGWDNELLAIEFAELDQAELTFDLEMTGFDTAEIDLILDPAEASSDRPDPLDDLNAYATDAPAISRLNELWLLGEHRLLCGDALQAAAYQTLLGSERAHVVFADPPYNVPIQGHVSGLGAVRHREFVMASGEMTESAFIAFLTGALSRAVEVCVDGALLFVTIDWRHSFELMSAARAVGIEQKNLCIWTKTNAGMGSFYRSQHELIYVYKHGRAAHTNTFGLGQTGRYRTNVWRYPGANSFGVKRLESLQMHPTVKPVALVMDAIKDSSRRHEVILDPFAGSGTTLIAAEKTRRRGHCIELDPRYVDVTVRRWQALTGRAALHAASGQTFAQVERHRTHRGEVAPDHRDGASTSLLPPTTRRRRPPAGQEVARHD